MRRSLFLLASASGRSRPGSVDVGAFTARSLPKFRRCLKTLVTQRFHGPSSLKEAHEPSCRRFKSCSHAGQGWERRCRRPGRRAAGSPAGAGRHLDGMVGRIERGQGTWPSVATAEGQHHLCADRSHRHRRRGVLSRLRKPRSLAHLPLSTGPRRIWPEGNGRLFPRQPLLRTQVGADDRAGRHHLGS